MGSIKDRVAIVGMGCTKFGTNWDKSANDMMVDAAFEAFEDAGIGIKDLNAAWFSSFFCPLALLGNLWQRHSNFLLFLLPGLKMHAHRELMPLEMPLIQLQQAYTMWFSY